MTPRYTDTSERTAVMAGSFNPFTLGHLSILKRGLQIFDRIIVMVGINASKSEGAAGLQRVEALAELLSPLGERVSVTSCSGLVALEARRLGAVALLRGVRSVTDFEYERDMAEVNRTISGLDTVILMAEPQLASISSSVVRELSSYGLDVSSFLPSTASITK